MCRLCNRSSITISSSINVCVNCLREKPVEALNIAMEIHRRYRAFLGLPIEPPRDVNGVKCRICVNECSIPKDSVGYCGVWRNSNGVLTPVEGYGKSIAYAYLDPLPTNCVATPVCPAATGVGYPKYAISSYGEYGYYNLAVFFAGCNLDCVFCQNWDHKDIITSWDLRKRYTIDREYLIEKALKNDRITCICFFGGDPGPHIIDALYISRKIVENKGSSIKRICWETNGLVNTEIMREMARLSLESGGIVKIDWKAWTSSIYQALTGIDGYRAVERIKKNVELVAKLGKLREEVPLLVISILLVPGYVDTLEVLNIAKYIVSIDSRIPLILLAFHPDHLLRDLSPTSKRHAYEAYKIAKEVGVERVYIGNEWLLGNYY
ncbi:Radical SAM domain protein [Ignisphaera aggregans DSM 17230]|uniref:Radical SAM domain protein n=1 Tax=Ignisphaera aggregans (strain DSM 17230 / JCM 13409 / AQ1.S1) TaxID=583356 RepID=E0SQF2_IGNAA|nr:Radical SAM domain protein [Ignisphaera aggregans DSM 17230]